MKKKFQHVCHTIFVLSKFTRLNSLPFTSTAVGAATLGTFRKSVSSRIAMQQALHQNPFSTTSKLFFLLLHLASESRADCNTEDFSFQQKLVWILRIPVALNEFGARPSKICHLQS